MLVWGRDCESEDFLYRLITAHDFLPFHSHLMALHVTTVSHLASRGQKYTANVPIPTGGNHIL